LRTAGRRAEARVAAADTPGLRRRRSCGDDGATAQCNSASQAGASYAVRSSGEKRPVEPAEDAERHTVTANQQGGAMTVTMRTGSAVALATLILTAGCSGDSREPVASSSPSALPSGSGEPPGLQAHDNSNAGPSVYEVRAPDAHALRRSRVDCGGRRVAHIVPGMVGPINPRQAARQLLRARDDHNAVRALVLRPSPDKALVVLLRRNGSVIEKALITRFQSTGRVEGMMWGIDTISLCAKNPRNENTPNTHAGRSHLAKR